jgi:hypothetical protein
MLLRQKLLKINGMSAAPAGKQDNLIEIVPVWKLDIPVRIYKIAEASHHYFGHTTICSLQVADAVSGHFFGHKAGL